MSLENDQRGYLSRVMERTGWSQTELALRAGLDPSTLSRFLSGAREGHALRPNTMRKIETASGLAFPSEGSELETVEKYPAGFAEPEAEPFVAAVKGPLQAALEALGGGRPNVDPWTLRSRALESAGYRPGDILLVALGETPVAGDVVCAQIYDWAKGRADTVFRLFQPPYLVAATGDPQFLRPFLVDDSAVAIKGVVLGMIRARPSA